MNHRLHVLFISEVPGSSTEGSERLMNELARALAQEVDLSVRHIPIDPARTKWSSPLTTRDSHRFDVVHYFPIGSLTVGALLRARLWRMVTRCDAMVLHAFQCPVKLPSPAFVRWSLGVSSVVATPSTVLFDFLIRHGRNCCRIPPGLDTAHFRPPSPAERAEARSRLGVGSESVLLHVGHIRRSRNLGALAELARSDRNLRVVMVVSPRLPEDHEVAAELESSGVVLLRGTIDVRSTYWGTDRYLFPVQDPNAAVAVPLSVLEALGCGVPVVTTRFDGLPAALGDHQPGVTWVEGSFAQGVREALATPSPASRAIADRVARRFMHATIAGQFVSIYRQLTAVRVE